MHIHNTISILGCGWLGLPLAIDLKQAGFWIKGSTTTPEKLKHLEANGIEPFLLVIEEKIKGKNHNDFFACDTLVISFPPRLRLNDADYFLKQIDALISAITQSKIKQVIFISSTAVYNDLCRVVVEEDVNTENTLAKAERNLKKAMGEELTILRMGGLMGYNRIPAKYFSGQKGLTIGQIPVNYIHRDDAVGIIRAVIEQRILDKTLNATAPEHPVRKAIYEKNCADFGFEYPEFVEPKTPHDFKIIGTERLLTTLNYTFKYPNPLDFYYEKLT